MSYEDFFGTLDELFTSINGAVEVMADLDSIDIDDPYFSCMFDKYDGAFDDLDEFMEEEIQE